jgi:predicted RNase H-like HicB family nuclease
MAPAILEAIIESESYARSVAPHVEWQNNSAYRCDVYVEQDDNGRYTAYVLNLPGAASDGDSVEEAIENVAESVRGLILVYKDSGEAIPWKDYTNEDIPANARRKRILVNV